MNPILIIKAGSTYPAVLKKHGDFEDWIIGNMPVEKNMFSVIDVVEQRVIPDLDRISGIMIAGSHAMVTSEEPWQGEIVDYVRNAVENNLPVLGICYGHQLLAHAMGGTIAFHPKGREIGTTEITCTHEAREDILFQHMPPEFPAHAAHLQTIIQLPPGATVLAINNFESCHAFRVRDYAWGIQFHPEFSVDILEACIHEIRSALVKEGFNPDELLSNLQPTPMGKILLQQFFNVVTDNF
jgi:GMP synthase (glutamine-hydrolysing)